MTNETRAKEAIASRLVVTRQSFKLTQSEFAIRAKIPVNTYNQYEKAVNTPSLEFAIKLCDAYTLTLDWIYLGDPSGLRYQLGKDLDQRLGQPQLNQVPRRVQLTINHRTSELRISKVSAA